jgi:hypothetical protein
MMPVKICFKITVTLIFLSFGMYAQEYVWNEKELTINQYIDGTLLLPQENSKPNLAIIIPGSGPTDRNGNQNLLKNNSLKKLAEALSGNGIATFRYDKRIVKQIKRGFIAPNISFDDFITDAISVLNFFKSQIDFNKIYLIGHSQGSLVGMIAAKDIADGFISLSGAGKPVDELITDQIMNTAPNFIDDTKRVFSILRKGQTTEDYPVALGSIFNIDVQPFMMSWMRYDPKVEIGKLNIPILIINGSNDFQVSVDEAQLLKASAKNAQIQIIERMNHVLVPINGDNLENSKSYNETFRKLSLELIDTIVTFMN